MSKPPRTLAGFSLVEGLVVVAVIGLMAAVLIPAISGAPDAAKKAKLEQDVVIVNNAIDAYLVAGGPQAGLGASGVIETLKQKIYGGVAAEMTGPQGPFLDPTVVTRPTDFAWSARFEASPRPRFVVQNSRDGVVFARGPASVVGGPAAGSQPSWLWSYAAPGAGPASKPIFEPETIEAVTRLGISSSILTGLAAPVISPASQTLTISGFPLLVNIVNPNPAGSSIVYYKINSGSYTLWVNSPFNVDPGSTVIAAAVSIDPSRYYNSPASTATYQVTPLILAVNVSAPSTVTYAQAGGIMLNQPAQAASAATVSLGVSVPAPYLSSANFAIRYTTDGSDPLSSGTASNAPAFNTSFPALSVGLGLAAWGTNSSIRVRAVAVSLKPEWFTTSSPAEATSTIAPTALTLTVVPANPIGLPFQVLISEATNNIPTGLRKLYKTGGSAPLSSASAGLVQPGALIYTAPIPAASLPQSSYTLIAQATGPSGYERWFSSPAVTRSYNTVTVLPSDFVGANISGGDVNGVFRGSIFVSAPADLGIFNAGGQITGGNLYVPGLPGIEIPGSGNSTKTVAQSGRAYVESGEIPRTLVAGKEYSADGQLAVPQLDTRQVVDLSGSLSPSNYTVKITKSAFIEGKIYRRADAPPPPAVPTVPLGLTVYTNTITGTFQTNIPAGVYSNKITMNATNAVLRLGVAGSSVVSQYVFSGNTWDKGTVEVLGPVEIYFLDGFNNKGVAFGNSNNVALNTTTSLRINVMTNAVDITGGGSVYATLWANNSAMTVGNVSFFYGNIFAKTLTVSPGGTVNVE